MNRMEQGIASIPRQTMIRDQPHMLAYITPAEAMLLKQNGGSGLPSHGGVPEFGFWSDTFGGGNSFSQSVANVLTPRDGTSYEGGEIIDNEEGRAFEDTINYHTYHGEPQDALYKEDDKPLVQVAQPMYQAPAPVNVAPPTLDPISSGQPRVPVNTDDPVFVGRPVPPSDIIARPPAMPIGQRPANKAYTFQELLGMYQNPYA